MIRNVHIKKFLVNCCFPLLSALNKTVKKDKNVIFIYCANNRLADNSYVLYKYLMDNGYDAKYKIVVGGAENEVPDADRASFIGRKKCIMQYMKSGHVFYSQGKIPIKPSKNQCVINMWHGTPLKKIAKLSNLNNGEEFFFTYLCASSEMIKHIMAKAFGCPEENVFINGEPKSDLLFQQKAERKRKLIVWTPTFRQSEFLGYNNSSNTDLLPLFSNEQWDSLNNKLTDLDLDMIVKLHAGQDLHGFYFKEFSNLKIYSDKAFAGDGLELWSLLSQSDALMTDYSSVYLNYLLVNRPICFVVPDMDEYAESRGFVFDDPIKYMPGKIVKDADSFFEFLEDFRNGHDDFEEQRVQVNDVINYYKDGNCCRRVLERSGIVL